LHDGKPGRKREARGETVGRNGWIATITPYHPIRTGECGASVLGGWRELKPEGRGIGGTAAREAHYNVGGKIGDVCSDQLVA